MKRIKRYQAAILQNEQYQNDRPYTKMMDNLGNSISGLNQLLATIWKEIKTIKQSNLSVKHHAQTPVSDSKNYHHKLNQRVDDFRYCNQQQKQNVKYENLIQKRFTKIDVPISEHMKSCTSNQRVQEILVWLGIVCKRVFSVSFAMLMAEQLDINKVKSYCSENILRNLIRLSECIQISAQQISAINQTLKNDLLPYLCLKYPQTQETGINLNFSSILINRDEIEDDQNDLVKKSGVTFSYSQTGIYNSEIMKFYNYIIALPNTQIYNNQQRTNDNDFQETVDQQNQKKKDLKKYFYNDMENIFTSIYKQFNQLQLKNSRELKNRINTDQIQKEQNFKTKQQQKRQKQYEQKVKSYTNYQIGQKLPKNFASFSMYQIQSGNLSLKNPQLMRVTAKWCEQIWKCFEKKSIIIDRQYPFKMKDGSFRYLDWNQTCMLYVLLQREKKQILKKLEQIQKDNYQHQSYFMGESLPQNLRKFDKDQAMFGMFGSAMFKNYENYLISYLNILIHGIQKVVRDFSSFQKVYRVTSRRKQYKDVWLNSFQQNEQQLNEVFRILDECNKKWVLQSAQPEQIPQLITFKIGDLLRCRCSSKQNQIIALYKQVQKISSTKPQLLRIVRVKDRLNGANKDILINLIYRNTLLIQMQLAIKSEKSKFIENSYKFNHYIYQLIRAQFGPIMEMCNIWISKDLRAQFYLKQIQPKRLKNNINNVGQLASCCSQVKNRITLYLPFRCIICSTFYYDCNGSQKHFKCKTCAKQVCYLCHLQLSTKQRNQFIKKTLSQFNLHSQQLKQIKFVESIPQQGGIIVNLKSKKKKSLLFKTIQYNNQYYLFDCKYFEQTRKVKLIKKFSSNKIKQQFLKENIILVSPDIVKLISEQLNLRYAKNFYFVPNYLNNCKNSQKTSISLQTKSINTEEVFQMQHINDWQQITKLNLQNNQLTSIQNLPAKFPNASLIILNQNQIKKIPQNCQKWSHLETINLISNKIQKLQNIEKIPKLAELNVSSNQITIINDKFTQLANLRYLNLSSNKLKNFPDSFVNLSKLQNLVIKFNRLQSLPQNIGALKQLKMLDLQSNKLSRLPQSLKDLTKLQFMILNQNCFVQIPPQIGCLQKLKTLDVGINKIQYLPEQIGNLKQLQKLLIFSNELTKLPDSIGNLEKIKQIGARSNKLTELPHSLGNLKTLVSLRISMNLLKQLPNSIGNLKNLKHFDSSNNRLQSLPQSIGGLQSIVRIRVWMNKLQSIPQSIGNLKNLLQFNASDNCLTSLPNSIGKLKKLKQLAVYKNKLVSLPQQIGNLSQLTLLKVSFNSLQRIPKTIEKLQQLRQILLNQNKLTQFPQQLTNLQQLRILKIYSNQILSFPDRIGNLKNLNFLDISKNKIKIVNQYLCNLYQLKKLRMSDNQIINLPNQIDKMANLQELDLKENCLTFLPQTLGNLRQLGCLKVRSNKLDSLPNSIGNLKKLKILDVGFNKLKQLPNSLGYAQSLQELNIQNNDLQMLPSSIENLKYLKKLSVQNNQKLKLDLKILQKQPSIAINN